MIDVVVTLERSPAGELLACLATPTTACVCGGVLHQVAGVWRHPGDPVDCPTPQVETCRCPHARGCDAPVSLAEPCALASPACCGGCWDRTVTP